MQPESHALLLIEDDSDQRDALAFLLEDRGYSVTAAATGRAGLHHLADGLHPCLIVLDLMLPDMDGVDFMRAYHQASGDGPSCAPVILYSAGIDLGAYAHAGGAAAYVQKPDLDRLFHYLALLC